MSPRRFDRERDLDAVARIWREVGWITDETRPAMEHLLKGGPAWVTDLDGTPECHASSAEGSFRHTGHELPMCCITAVTTSHVARRRGLAGRLTALAMSEAAAGGSAVAALGMFDQGFYDRLGFGSGSNVRFVTIDPDCLRVDHASRAPVRLGADDWERIHASRMARRPFHGQGRINSPWQTRAEMAWTTQGFGLGFADDQGRITHHLWMGVADRGEPEHGPYAVQWLAHQTIEQYHELLGLLRNLGDQVHGFRLPELPGISLQALVDRPFRTRRITKGAKFDPDEFSWAWWQLRICDLERCIGAVSHAGPPVRFSLRLDDPVERYLEEGSAWRGIGGEYVVTLGETSGVEPGHDATLPTLETGVGTLSRLWMGVAPATGLAYTDELSASPELLAALDRVFTLPPPCMDWDF
jgi:hypothetical protein